MIIYLIVVGNSALFLCVIALFPVGPQERRYQVALRCFFFYIFRFLNSTVVNVEGVPQGLWLKQTTVAQTRSHLHYQNTASYFLSAGWRLCPRSAQDLKHTQSKHSAYSRPGPAVYLCENISDPFSQPAFGIFMKTEENVPHRAMLNMRSDRKSAPMKARFIIIDMRLGSRLNAVHWESV